MASKQGEEELAFSAAYEDDTPTPSGWKRKLVPRIGKGLIPVRTDVIFITPTGEEFTSKAQLQRYLKANKGSPSISEFIWSVDEFPKRSTRSKSTGPAEVKKVELPLKIASKRKPVKEVLVEEVKPSKRSRIEQKPKPAAEVKGKGSTVPKVSPPSEEKGEDKDVAGSTPVSPKRKRSVTTTTKTSRVPAGTKSVETNGEADLGTKDEMVEEVVEKPISQKASKKKPAKARTPRGGRKKGSKQIVADDTKEEAEGEDAVDESIPAGEATKAESDADVGDENHHDAEKDLPEVTVHTNGEADLSKKDEMVEEAIEKPISQKASKKKPTKARTIRGGRKKGTKQIVAEDTKAEAEAENGVDESSPGEEVTKAESDVDVGDQKYQDIEKESSYVTAHENERGAVIDEETHVTESNA